MILHTNILAFLWYIGYKKLQNLRERDKMSQNRVLLCILDGWGVSEKQNLTP